MSLTTKQVNYTHILFTFILSILVACKDDNSSYISAEKTLSETIYAKTHIIADDNFLGDQACKTCHQEQFDSWQGSHHDKAMQIASETTVLANFNDVSFTNQSVTSTFFKENGNFYVNTEGPDGKYHDYKIEYTFGITPLQQYIVKFPDGHYQCLRTAWDTEKKKWFDLYPDFKVIHSEWLHWSRGGLNWNNMCSDCHSTNVRENYNQSTHSYNTKYSIINVSCEACHGPGKKHISDVERLGSNYKPTGTLQMTSDTAFKTLVDQCARCHMRREQISGHFNFEGTLLDHYFPQLLTEGIYHPDGQILDEDYVYGSFLQSKMYHNDVTCTSCHDAHSLDLKFQGNNLCNQCHIPETYDTPKHHFHTQGTEAALCINCHMTGKHYMGNDFRRDHSFRIPRPDQSLKYNTPNACTQCHKDKDNKWAWEKFKLQYGEPDYKHFSDLLAPGLTHDPNGLPLLMELAQDTIYPEIARASAIRAMTNYLTPQVIPDLLDFLKDHSSFVKGATLDVLGEINSNNYTNHFLPLLQDPKRSIRTKAFFAIGSLNKFQIPEEYKEAYKIVETEFNTYLKSTADFSGGQLKKGNYYLKKGNLSSAIAGYEEALKIDNINNVIRFNLANLYYNNQQFDKAETSFKTIIEQEPEYGPTYYSYSLLLAELGRTKDAIATIKEAIKLMPENERCYYNLGLLYDKEGNLKEAEKILIEGLNVNPKNENLLYTLAFIYDKYNKISKAKEVALKLLEIQPQNNQYINFYNQLSSKE